MAPPGPASATLAPEAPPIDEHEIATAAAWFSTARHLVVFTGAGISTESGLPDFRGPEGVWTRRDQGRPPPRSPSLDLVQPNPAHDALVRLHRMGRLAFLITQNVDDLHRKSGMPDQALAELHGNSRRSRCAVCGRTYSASNTPESCQCGCTSFRSSVVNFGDELPERDMKRAREHSEKADVFCVIGSSLQVTPAADLPAMALARGARLVLINLGDTPMDERATLRIRALAGHVMPAIVAGVEAALAT